MIQYNKEYFPGFSRMLCTFYIFIIVFNLDVCASVRMYATCMKVPLGLEESITSVEVEDTGSCPLPNMGGKNLIQVL